MKNGKCAFLNLTYGASRRTNVTWTIVTPIGGVNLENAKLSK